MPVIEDDFDLEFLLSPETSRKRILRRGRPQLPIGHAITRLNYNDLEGGPFAFLVGDRIDIYDNLNDLTWLGKNTRTGIEGKFENLYVQQEIPAAGLEGVGMLLETSSAINVREAARIQKQHLAMFGEDLDPKTIFKVLKGAPSSNYWDFLHCLSVVFPATAQWISLLVFEIESFRKFAGRNWQYVCWTLAYRFEVDFWEKVFGALLEEGLGMSAWTTTLERCRISIPNLELIWTNLLAELRQSEGLDELVKLEAVFEEMEKMVEMFKSKWEAMEVLDKKTRDDWEAAEQASETSQFNLILPYSAFQADKIDLEAGVVKSPTKQWLKRGHAHLIRAWDGTLTTLGSPYGVVYTVLLFATFGGVTTALATWKCSPPESTPTVDSNFWSTLASASIGTAGLFCTIIPILRGQPIKVANPKLFHQLLWASLVLAGAASVVYLFQTRASLVLLYLSSAAQLATTLQIIYGAVERIEDLERIVRRNGVSGV